MLKKENRYDFKKELLEVHKKDIRNLSLSCMEDEFEIKDEFTICIPPDYDKIIYTAAQDFCDYLFKSMDVSSLVSTKAPKNTNSIVISLNTAIEEASGYMGYRINIGEDGITLEGYDSRGVMQGLFFLEDLMNFRKAPYIKKEIIKKKALFTLRLAQSPFGMFEYIDEALSYMAHRGYDAIELWIKDVNVSLRGDYIDMPLLCERAEKYGIKVYMELYAPHHLSPYDEGAQEYYDNLYGKFFSFCPKLAGVTLVGEANGYETTDTHEEVGSSKPGANYPDNIHNKKCKPGWWPCVDYPDFVRVIKNAVAKHKKDADVIICSYNWGYAPEELRVKLIENLPDGVSIMATWDMFHQFKNGDSTERIVDYSLCFAGPGEYFSSEAIAAKKRGIRLYSITNTAGRTWDFGTIPFEPAPYQWIERFENIIKAHDEWNLTGMLECIHYAFSPSFIGDLEKWAFFTHKENLRDVLKMILIRDFGEENIEKTDKAMKLWSDAIKHYIPTSEDQYGPFRIGPSYPLWFSSSAQNFPMKGAIPSEYSAMFTSIYNPIYNVASGGYTSCGGVRLDENIRQNQIMAELLLKGIEVLESIDNPNDALLKLINIGKFMYRTCLTTINVKKLFILKNKLNICSNKIETGKLIKKIENLLLEEKENVEKTISIVSVDSRLGWEPSMEYQGDEKCLRWKLKQLDYELTYTLELYKKSNRL